MNCPRCQTVKLVQESYEGVTIDRCPSCKGTWLDEGELTQIVNTKDESFSAELVQETLVTAFGGVPKDEKRSIEKCPKCDKVMIPINYAYSSGVIIDRCPDDHGVWLDGSELERVQAHKEHWDQEAEQHHDEWMALADTVSEEGVKAADETRKREMRPTKYIINSLIRKVIGS